MKYSSNIRLFNEACEIWKQLHYQLYVLSDYRKKPANLPLKDNTTVSRAYRKKEAEHESRRRGTHKQLP